MGKLIQLKISFLKTFIRFIEKIKIEIGREIKEYRGQLEEVYEEMTVFDMSSVTDKKTKVTVIINHIMKNGKYR